MGPAAVAASLIRGLAQLGVGYALDPDSPLDRNGAVVGVLSDRAALDEAVSWRRIGTVSRVLAGPNVAVIPDRNNSVLAAPEVDVCVVPSPWVAALYEDTCPALAGRIAVWAAGVDASYWRPAPSGSAGRTRRALLYLKELPGQLFPDQAELGALQEALTQAGFEATPFVYGSGSSMGYREALQEADLVVFITPSESQCLAQVEAWATDVPTFVWDCGQLRLGRRVVHSSSGPYLTHATGRFFDGAEDLRNLLETWDELRPGMSPRAWVLDHMTDEASARAYLEIAGVSASAAQPSSST